MLIHAFSSMPKSLFYDKVSKCLNHLPSCTMLGERKGTPLSVFAQGRKKDALKISKFLKMITAVSS